MVKVRHQISIPTTRQQTDSSGKEYTVYNVNLRTKDMNIIRERRYNNFKMFTQEWNAIYPNLAQSYKLPSGNVLFKNSPSVVEKRRLDLQSYLRQTLNVACLQPFVCKFLEVDHNTIKIEDPTASRLRPGGQMAYIDLSKDTRRGNTAGGSAQALATKKAFIEQNKELLEMLMPGQELSLGKDALNLEVEDEEGTQYAKADQEFIPESGEEAERCIEFKEGDVIVLVDCSPESDWWFGHVEHDKENDGYFPRDFVTKFEKKKVSMMTSIMDRSTASFVSLLGGAINYESENSRSIALARKEPQLKIPLSDQIKKMVCGETFTKYVYRRGFSSKKVVFYRPLADSNSDLGCIFWCDIGKREMSANRCIALVQVTDVYIGKQTKAFEKSAARDALDIQCFSLQVGTKRTLDLEAENKETRDAWVVAFRQILEKKDRKKSTADNERLRGLTFHPSRISTVKAPTPVTTPTNRSVRRSGEIINSVARYSGEINQIYKPNIPSSELNIPVQQYSKMLKPRSNVDIFNKNDQNSSYKTGSGSTDRTSNSELDDLKAEMERNMKRLRELEARKKKEQLTSSSSGRPIRKGTRRKKAKSPGPRPGPPSGPRPGPRPGPPPGPRPGSQPGERTELPPGSQRGPRRGARPGPPSGPRPGPPAQARPVPQQLLPSQFNSSPPPPRAYKSNNSSGSGSRGSNQYGQSSSKVGRKAYGSNNSSGSRSNNQYGKSPPRVGRSPPSSGRSSPRRNFPSSGQSPPSSGRRRKQKTARPKPPPPSPR